MKILFSVFLSIMLVGCSSPKLNGYEKEIIKRTTVAATGIESSVVFAQSADVYYDSSIMLSKCKRVMETFFVNNTDYESCKEYVDSLSRVMDNVEYAANAVKTNKPIREPAI